MELELKAPGSPAQPATAADKPEPKPVAATQGDAATTVVEKPGRAAAAAKKAQREATARGVEADAKVAAAEKAKPVVASVEKYQEAIASGDPDKILAAFGMDDEKLVDLYIAKHGTKDTPEGATKAEKDAAVEELRAELAKFKQELADEKTKGEEKRKQDEAQAAVQSHVNKLREVAVKDPEKYELVSADPSFIRGATEGQYSSGYDLAFDVMVEVHKTQSKFITYEQALDATEQHLLALEKARSEHTSKLKKLGGTAAKVGEKPAPTGGDPSMDTMRAAFKAQRPRVTDSMTTNYPSAAVKARGKSEADKRFREKVLAAQRATSTN